MVVVEELSSEFEIKFVAERGDAFADVLRLDAEIFVVVESEFHNGRKVTVFSREMKPAPRAAVHDLSQTTALSFKPKKETYLPLPGSLRIG